MTPLTCTDLGGHLPVAYFRPITRHASAGDEGTCDSDARRATWFRALAGITVVDVGVEDGRAMRLLHQRLETIAPWFRGILIASGPGPLEFGAEENVGVPVFNEAADGTAVVACAATLRGVTAAGKTLGSAQFVISGAGPASIASAELLCALGVDNSHILVVDRGGVIHADRRQLEEPARSFALKTSRRTLQDAVGGADVFIGLSRTGVLTSGMLRRMAPHPVVVALADAAWGAWWPFTVQTRADALHVSADDYGFHQATDLLALPGLMRGTMDVNAAFVDDTMRAAAVRALAARAPGVRAQERGPRADDQRVPSLLPSLVDPCLVPAVASAVAGAALVSGAAPRRAGFNVEGYAAALRQSTSGGTSPAED